MKLYTYLRCRHFVECDESKALAEQAKKMANEILGESISRPGMYPTIDSMWRELLRRAKELDGHA